MITAAQCRLHADNLEKIQRGQPGWSETNNFSIEWRKAADRILVLERELEQAAIRFEMMHAALASLTGAALIGGENCRTPLSTPNK